MADDDRTAEQDDKGLTGRLFDRVVGSVVAPVVETVDVDDVVERIDVNHVIERLDLDEIIARVDLDLALSRVDVDALMSRVDVNALVERVDMDAVLSRIDVDALMSGVDANALVERVDVDAVLSRIDVDALMSRVDVSALAERVDVDGLVARVDANALVERVDLDAAIGRVDVGGVMERVDVDGLVARVDANALVERVDVDAMVGRVDVGGVMDRVDVDGLVARVDANALMERVDLDAAIGRLDVNAMVDQVDLDAALDRVDVNGVIDRVDADRLLERVDVNAVIQRTELGEVIARSTTGVFTELLDVARTQVIAVDQAVQGVAARLLRGRAREVPPMPTGVSTVDDLASMSMSQRAVALQRHAAGSVSRFLAFALDQFIIGLLFSAGLFVTSSALRVVVGTEVDVDDNRWLVAVAFVLWAFLYFAGSLAATGRTIGKAVMGVLVVRSAGEKLSGRRAMLRTIAFPISFLVFGVGFLLGLVRRDRRELHDLIADTWVVYAWDAATAQLRVEAGAEVIGVGVDAT